MTGLRRLAAPALALVVATVLGACGTAPSPTGLCERYAEVQASVQQLASAPVASGTTEQLQASADQLHQQVDKLRDALDRIQAVSDGRLDQAIGVARQQLDEIRAALVVARYAAAETLAPQITQAGEDIRAALAPVRNLLDSQCATG
ncbi:MAG TPA: hypothetical protein VE503_00725 [Ornithinibacter sp.]|jgi:DNA repair ATPase RecN|nr:hypothetical protein [Ornithinibacter sp.]